MSDARQIVLDTETTGLEPEQGHRIIEIGCIEISNRRITGANYHVYLNPEREIDEGAVAVHGLTTEMLSGEPRFADVADAFLAFVGDAELIIHNAPFDVGFINHELARCPVGGSIEECCTILDTLVEARRLHPGQRNSLDALCKRYGIDNSGRELHGALLDAQLLAEVYLAMTGGQTAMTLESGQSAVRRTDSGGLAARLEALGKRPRVILADEQEQVAHRERIAQIESEAGHVLWQED